MEILVWINFAITVLFAVCYSYQYIYIPISWFAKKKNNKKPEGVGTHTYAVLICARNEQEVIGDLIDCVKKQTYPTDKITTFVMADNCDDDTAEIAKAHGAVVYRRFNREQVGKGYALEVLRRHINEDYPEGFDGYFIFDADNLLEDDYIEQMDITFSEGNDIVTSYRNSKNYGSNWLSAGIALWFLRESRYLNYPRHILGNSCAVSGTGYMFSRKVADELGEWPFHMLTEDIEFTIDQITKGRKIAFCRKAEFYDEQPVEFMQSWNQRKRWSKGYLQVIMGYGKKLLSCSLHGSFSCFDMSMNIMPAFILSALSIICNISLGVIGAINGDNILIGVHSIFEFLSGLYAMLFAVGAITTITEWKHIHTTVVRKILYMFTFPVFMFTFLPISIAALFSKTSWKPIRHTMSVKNMRNLQRG